MTRASNPLALAGTITRTMSDDPATATPHNLLDGLLALAGRAAATRDEVTIEGTDPVFPLRLRVADAGAAAIAAAGLAAADLWELRSGRRQGVGVDVRAAAAAMRSGNYWRATPRDGEPAAAPPRARPSVSGFYPARDGRWAYLHCNFDHHRERIVSLLGCDDNPASVAQAVAGWDAGELESAVVATGACAGLVRSSDEWASQEQAKTVAGLPLFEVVKIGESPPEPLPAGDRPLSGLRVLDLTRVLAGPTSARTLAEHGADVLRISTEHMPDPSIVDTGHGKRSTVLDLQRTDGNERLHELIRGADVFAQGYRPGSFAARGFSPEQVAAERPGIVYMTLSAFGHEGPWSDRRGFDTLVQSVSGISDGYALNGEPRLLPVSALDYITGYIAAFGVLSALRRRATEGGSYMVRVSLAQTGHWLTSLPRIDANQAAAAPPELPAELIEALSTTSDSPFGHLTHLAPIAQLSETPARWERPAVPAGHHEPVWLD